TMMMKASMNINMSIAIPPPISDPPPPPDEPPPETVLPAVPPTGALLLEPELELLVLPPMLLLPLLLPLLRLLLEWVWPPPGRPWAGNESHRDAARVSTKNSSKFPSKLFLIVKVSIENRSGVGGLS